MTFGKFFLLVLFIYLVYYGFLLLLEKLKVQKSSLPLTSKRVDFIVEQPTVAFTPKEAETSRMEVGEKKNDVIEKASTNPGDEEEKNILDDLGIEAYFSNSIDVTEDNLLTLIHDEP